MIQNRKNKNTEKGLASDNRNKTITNINKSSSNIQQAVEGTATPIHERAQTTNINKSSSNIQQAVEGTATQFMSELKLLTSIKICPISNNHLLRQVMNELKV
ncbi:hypothetical protein GLOIN_2v1786166 [Rhizophagus irregularis DAOM 181602=DAOM 197198]|nr:hypothetical protein GLOIN_2v1786166 [Rhizophagus irregularis DAOM 181602=DAOM 197198]POG61798.1 hypothetical protein GLOIN_2v1786166 [Rhizophagus irregularis DAOM 181602=DAOM 197198]|eukprot:XP_025168664.1 hypothetical protein GLOIN_2v1786166 [Rhizophagus irregularis DAOM 181602=DAOM 197198]